MNLGMLMLMAAALPPNRTRQTPPPGIEEHALPVGAVAPGFTLPDTTGGQWTLHGLAVLVFYRGYW
jgi:hypothetical protein